MTNPVKGRALPRLGCVLVCLLLVLASTVRLESIPPVEWDEGWTMSVARNWVEKGFYGRLFSGNYAQPGLNASITVTGLVALAFRFLGIGIWQGRIVGVFFLLGAVTVIYLLTDRLYGRVTANFTVAVVFLTATIFPQMHPLISGRQVLAEIPMLFFVLSGYLCFYISLTRSLWVLPAAVFFWAIGVITKAQTPPFFGASLLLPMVLTIHSRQWKYASILAVGLVSTLLTAKGVLWLQALLLQHYGLPRTHLIGIYSVVALVPDLEIRWLALQVSVFLLPAILGLLYEGKKILRPSQWNKEKSEVDILRLMLLGFSGTWLIWYALLSNAYPRYAFPAMFVASIFAAQFLRDLIDPHIEVFASQKMGQPDTKKFSRVKVWRELALAMLLIAVWSGSTLKMLYRTYLNGNTSAMEVAVYLNTQTPEDALIETYDSEVQFLLNRRYHFPHDQTILDLIRRAMVGHKRNVPVEYDALAVDPDYLVVGDFVKGLRLYDPVIHAGAFRFLRSFNQYDVYERVR